MAQAKKGLGRGLSALIPTDMDFLAEVARGDFSILTPAPEAASETVAAAQGHPSTSSEAVARGGAAAPSASSQTEEPLPFLASDVPAPDEDTPRVLDVELLPLPAHWPFDQPSTPYVGSREVPHDPATSTGAVVWVRPSAIVANPYQPRRSFDEAEMKSLTDSIREHGILQPILVRPLSMAPAFALDAEPTGGKLELIAGERRWRAAQEAGLDRVPVIVRQVSDQQALELAIIENVQRHDISALDEAVALKRLSREFGLSHDSIARRVGKSRSAVTNTMRLLELPPEAQQAIQDRAISEGHGRAILLAPGDAARRAVLRAVLRSRLSVRQAEDLAGRVARQAKRDAEAQAAREQSADPAASTLRALQASRGREGEEHQDREGHEPVIPEHEDAALEEQLQRALSCEVKVRRRRAGGQIVLFASDTEQLERIAAALSSLATKPSWPYSPK